MSAPIATENNSSQAREPRVDSLNGSAAHAPLVALNLTARDATQLPAKLQWFLVGHYRAAGALSEADELLREIEARRGPTLQLLEERARLAFAANRPDDAVAFLKERVSQAPAPTARAALARLYVETGDLARAHAISDDLARHHPDLATVAALVADVARARGDYETARGYYLGFLDAKPDSVVALLALARLALDEEDTDTGRNFLRRAITTAGDAATPNQLTTAATLLAELGDDAMASDLRARASSLEQARVESFVAQVRQELGAKPLTRPAAPQPRAPALPRTSAAPPPEEPEAEATAVTTTVEEPPVDSAVLDILRREFGHPSLRPGQASVIDKVLGRQDTLAIMPTGAGKSLTFQLPAMLLPGVTLVISPLISLMKDQVDKLPADVRSRTALINSTLSPEEMRQALIDVGAGSLKLVYIAPERLRHHAFLRAIRTAGVSLVVVDEAHCISMWGHDFRPDYLSIPRALPELGNPPVLAITATAPPSMISQIAAGFGRELDLVRVSLFRPNLRYEVHQLPNREAKVAKVVEICRQERGTGIVYVSSRKDTESVAGILRDRGVGALPYHAGLDPLVRSQNQERFMTGRVRVVVATVAFGMGVDKANVRFIIHLSPPPSLAAYAQESGRAGRDGNSARCVLLVAPSDQASLNRNARRDEMEPDTLRRVYAGIKHAASDEWAIVEPSTLLARSYEDDEEEDDADPRVALGLLEQAGLIRRHPDAPVSYALQGAAGASPPSDADEADTWRRFIDWLGPNRRHGATIRTAEACDAIGLTPRELDLLMSDRDELIVRDGPRLTCLQVLPVRGDAAATLTNLLDQARADARRRIKQVMDYATGSRCRHAVLAGHLGERLKPCGSSCDVCTGQAADPQTARTTRETTRANTTAADALAVLEAVRTLPFTMGKTGLVKLLTGSVESRLRADRSQSFGALKDVKKSKVEGLIDQLVDDGLLFRDLNHEFKIIQITQRGAAASLDDLTQYELRPPTSASRSSSKSGPDLDADLSPENAALLEALYDWRRQKASADAVPPYVIAHNSTLRNLAGTRPTTPAALLTVPGFGPARVEKYSVELLAIIARF